MHEAADVIRMVVNAEMLSDQRCDARRCPEIRSVPMSQSSPQQELHEPTPVLPAELGGPPGREANLERSRTAFPLRIPPPENRAGRAADAPRDFLQGEMLIKELQSTTSAFFNKRRRSTRSHDGHLLCQAPILLRYLCSSQ
jgi:hypothetical protein